MTTYLGLDISTKCGVVFYNPSTSVTACEVIHYPVEHPRYNRWHRYIDTIDELRQEYRPEFAAIEGYGFARRANLLPLVELGTLIREHLSVHGIPWIEVAPTSLKKYCTGSGRASKTEMVKAVRANWGLTTAKDDIADAYALARIAENIHSDDSHIIGPERGEEVIDMLLAKENLIHE